MTKKKEANFEASMQRLNAIVEQIEGGDLSLDDSLKLYEEGIQITQGCAKRLETAENRIEMLMRTTTGQVATQSVDAKDLKPKSKGKKAK